MTVYPPLADPDPATLPRAGLPGRPTPAALAACGLIVLLALAPAGAQTTATAATPTPVLPQIEVGKTDDDGQPRLHLSVGGEENGPHDGQQPIFFEADQIEGDTDERTRATGHVRLRQGDLTVRADELVHTQADNTAHATGGVTITRAGNIFTGPELTLKLDTLEGEFVHPRFWFARTQAGGQADHVQFLGQNRLLATHTTYSSCTPENTADGQPGEPDWALQTSEVYLDPNANEGRAKNAVIRFMGVPILAAPTLTFPLNDQRKSGWLPPTFDYDSKSGFEFSAPYYWNIEPQQDMTLIPLLSTRRGVGLETEYRYLGESDEGTLHLVGRPNDRVAERDRGLLDFKHVGKFNANTLSQTDYDIQWLRVSDDDYWRDFSTNLPSLTPRLYDSHVRFEKQLNARNWGLGDSQTTVYGGVQTWQTLRDLDLSDDPTLSQVTAPYRREPQLGVRSRSGQDTGLVWGVKSEFNRFVYPDDSKPDGNRLQISGEASYPTNFGGITVTPKVALHSTHYNMDEALSNGSRSADVTVPTFSLDTSTSMEREVNMFGHDLIQTLEPRIKYVRTPYRDQSALPLFDTATRDFNQYAIYSENAYTGGDRITDANQVTVGATSRLINPKDGTEAMRLGVVQKVLLSDQRINPDGDGPITQRLSDLLLLGSTSVIPKWNIDSYLQFDPQTHATESGMLSVRYSPGAWRTVSVTYRYTRDSTEQWEFGWQWPFAGRTPPMSAAAQVRSQALDDPLNLTGQRQANTGACGGTWYTVGRVNYSAREHNVTDSVMGIEYDAGCWIGRVVAQRQAQGATRVMFQLELIGLSRISLGSNPLRALKNNVPGYTLLNDPGKATPLTGNATLSKDDD